MLAETAVDMLLRDHNGMEVLKRLQDKGQAWKAVLAGPPEGTEEYQVYLAQCAQAAVGSRIPRPVSETFASNVVPGPQSIKQFMNHLKQGKSISYLDTVRILKASLPLIQSQNTLGQLNGDVVVVGDLHGQIGDLLLILDTHGLPRNDLKICFNGDYVDRGNNGCEVFCLVLLLKLAYPDFVHINRGNHEDEALNLVYGFYDECTSKYGHYVYTLFRDVFMWLPLCCTINSRVFVVHGGLYGCKGVTLKEISQVPRGPHARLSRRQVDICTHSLWSDPNPADLGAKPSPRGEGVLFGEDVTGAFLAGNSLQMVVRSHQYPGEEGYLLHHKGTVFTVFSASNYTLSGWNIETQQVDPGDNAERKCNKGSVVKFTPQQKNTEHNVYTYEPPMWVADDPRNSAKNPHTKRPFQYSVPYGTLSAMYRGGVDPVERCVNHIRNSCVRHAALLLFYWGRNETAAGQVSREVWLYGIASVTNIAQCTVIAPSLETALRNRGFVNSDGSVRYNAFLQQASYLCTPRPLPSWHTQLMRVAVSKERQCEGTLPATTAGKGLNEVAVLSLMKKHLPEVPLSVLTLVSGGIRGGAGFKSDEDDEDAIEDMVDWVFTPSVTAFLECAEQRIKYLLRLAHTRDDSKQAVFIEGCNLLLGAPLSPAALNQILNGEKNDAKL